MATEARRRAKGLGPDLARSLLIALLAWGLPASALRFARPALLNFGPNDTDYIRGFREGWERDGRTRFHWTTQRATVTLPLHVRGEGLVLRARLRRHLIEPARVTLKAEGRTVAAFDVEADTKIPYRVLEVPLPLQQGRHPFVLLIEAPSSNPRPLGIALDWLEVERRGPQSRFSLPASMRLRILLVAVVAYVAPRLAGAGWGWALGHALALVGAMAVGTSWDVLAAERILREGLPAYAFVACLALALARWRRSRGVLGLTPGPAAGALVLLVLLALAVRLTLLLHPQFYYPDVKVHALFAWQLARRGLAAFLNEFTLNQYRYSLGLQMEGGHWYAFPYPPVFYLLSWPLVRAAGYAPEVAVSILAAAVNSLETLLVFGIARGLTLCTPAALGAAAAVPVLPLFLARLTLAYFPALVGHAVDALVLLYLVRNIEALNQPRVVLTLGGLLAAALLTYTQSILNFAILLLLFLAFQAAFDRTPASAQRAAGLAAAGALGALLSLALFYGRYVPIFLDMRRGIPMPEEKILLEKLERSQPGEDEAAPEEPDDPYSGPGIAPLRGVRKAAWRLYIFYALYSPLVVAGLLLLLRRLDGALARLVAAWALTYLVLNLASGGLPGPNLVRYNKDLEIVAPLFCVGLGLLGLWLWRRTRLGAIVYAAGFCGFGAWRAARYLTGTFVLER